MVLLSALVSTPWEILRQTQAVTKLLKDDLTIEKLEW